MYPLLLCSIISLAVIIERSIFWIIAKKNRNISLSNEVLDLFLEGKWDIIRDKTKNTKDYVIKVIISGILHREFSMSKAMEAAANREVKKMRKYMSVIDTMITVAPLLGILGTVLGIITSFDALAEAGIEQPQAVTAGIAQALLTTAAGLSIAIFSVFPYNFFNSRITEAAEEIERYGTNSEIVWEKINKKDDKKEPDE